VVSKAWIPWLTWNSMRHTWRVRCKVQPCSCGV